jgi:hypothetical protein
VVLAVLLVAGSGLAVAAWGLHAGQKVAVLAVGRPVAAGHVVTREDLVTVSVAGVAGAVPASETSTVVGKTAVTGLLPGQIVTDVMVTGSVVPGPGEATVGLALGPDRLPGAGLDAGDVVGVIGLPAGQPGETAPAGKAGKAGRAGAGGGVVDPEVLVASAGVYATDGVATPGGDVLVTLIVPADVAARVAAYSAQDRVALVEISPATTQDGGDTP